MMSFNSRGLLPRRWPLHYFLLSLDGHSLLRTTYRLTDALFLFFFCLFQDMRLCLAGRYLTCSRRRRKRLIRSSRSSPTWPHKKGYARSFLLIDGSLESPQWLLLDFFPQNFGNFCTVCPIANLEE